MLGHGRRCNLEIYSRSCTGLCTGGIEAPPTTGPQWRRGWHLRQGIDYSLFQQGEMAISSGSGLERLRLIHSLAAKCLNRDQERVQQQVSRWFIEGFLIRDPQVTVSPSGRTAMRRLP